MCNPYLSLLAVVTVSLATAFAAEPEGKDTATTAATGLEATAITKSGKTRKKKKDKDTGLAFVMKKHPSLRAGDWLKMDMRLKVQTDLREVSDSADQLDLLDPRRFRVGVQGRLFNDVEFEVEYELLPADHQLRDAFVNYRRYRTARLQAGKFKIPFGLDQLTGPTNLDFVYRSRIGNQLTPGRDNGVMLHGQLFESGFRYQAGVFQHDGENAEAKDDIPTGGRTVAGRLSVSPLHFIPAPAVLRNLELSTAMTRSDVDEGLHGLRGRTVAGDTYFDRMYMKGARTRQGLEADWRIRSLALKGEYINVRQQRREQSLRGTDLPDLLARGWYVSATHPLLGSRKGQEQAGLLRSLLPGTSLGLIEAAIRLEQIRFGSRLSPGANTTLSRSVRATNVLGNSDRGLTLGINWDATRFTRFQFNAIRETLEDSIRFPVSGTKRYWTYTGRIQFIL
jgi:phosphate-selective porin OprO/OprP